MNILNQIISNFKTNQQLYIGEKVTIAEHMIQTAMMAEKNASSSALICASLLHDYGHFIIEDPDNLVKKSLDGKHEDIGYQFLRNYFSSSVTEPIKLHVLAKRFLCRNKNYYENLSKASKVSLQLQGGVMSDSETNEFLNNKYAEDAIKLRKFDDAGKIADIKIKSIDEFKKVILENFI